jgi:hypothetical protein
MMPRPAPCGNAQVRESLDHVEHVFLVARAKNAALTNDAIEYGIRTCQRSSVRRCRAGPGAAAPDLCEHERFAEIKRSVSQRNELTAVAQAFDISSAYFDARICKHFVHDLRERDIAFVAGIHEETEP